MPTHDDLYGVSRASVYNTISEVLLIRGREQSTLAIVVLYECLVIIATMLDSDRNKANFYLLKKRVGAESLREARNTVSHFYGRNERVSESVPIMANLRSISEICRCIGLGDLVELAKNFEAALISEFSEEAEKPKDMYSNYIVGMIPSSMREKYPRNNREAALQYAYEMFRHGI